MTSKTTRSARGGGNIRRRYDGRWEARYKLGTDPKTGKQIQKSVYGKTQKEVRQKLAKITAEIDDGSFLAPNRINLEDWLNEWLDNYCIDKKYLTMKSYRNCCKTHIIPALGHVHLQKLTPQMLQRFYNKLHKEKKLAPKTVHNIHAVLRAALEQAIRNDWLQSNPCKKVVLPRGINQR